MRCAKGICAKGSGGCTRFSLLRGGGGKRVRDSLLRWKKGSETPSLPRSEHEERQSLRPLFPPQEGVSDPFSHRKRENLVHPPNPLAQIPLAQRMSLEILSSAVRVLQWHHCLKLPLNNYFIILSHRLLTRHLLTSNLPPPFAY